MREWKKCKVIKQATRYWVATRSWVGFKELHIGFGAPDGDYLTACFRGSIGQKCQHIRLTEDEARWLFTEGNRLLDSHVKHRQEEYENEKKEREARESKEKARAAEPTKEQQFQKELEARRDAMERERKRRARKLTRKLLAEIEGEKRKK